jgi:hypothetical protein
MQLAVDDFEKDRSNDIDALKHKIESLRRQFKENPAHAKPLSWDTELLLKKTRNLSATNIVSCADANWQQTLERMRFGREGVRVDDVRTVAHIEFVAAFAARHQLLMTYGNRSFLLEPRQTSID